jgi:hypothetical protein
MAKAGGRHVLAAGLFGALLCAHPAEARSHHHPAVRASHEAYRGTVQDFVDINQLFARYDFTIDNGDAAGWAANFTADGVFRDPSWCAVGREQLAAVVASEKHAMGSDQRMHHVPTIGPINYLDRNHATVHSTVMVVSEKGAGHPDGGIGVTGAYDDALTRDHGRWLFAYRLVHRPSNKPAVPCAAKPPYDTGEGP